MQKCNLILHCGAAAVDRSRVELAHTPERTDTWCPIAHSQLLNEVQRVLTEGGMSVVSESHALTLDGNRYFGLLQVVNGQSNDDFGLVIAVRNSHDKSFPAALALGAQVFCCDNLSFRGEVTLARKHTIHIERDLPGLVLKAVGLLENLRVTQAQRFERYQQTELADKDAHDLVVRAVDARILPVTRIPELLQEWRAPRHPEFKEKNVWRLMNGFTEVLKGSLTELPRRTIALQGLLDGTCGLLLPATEVNAPPEPEVAVPSLAQAV
jgi:hypothetical protein